MINQRMEVNEGKKEQAYQTKATLVLFPKFKKRTNGLRVYVVITQNFLLLLDKWLVSYEECPTTPNKQELPMKPSLQPKPCEEV